MRAEKYNFYRWLLKNSYDVRLFFFYGKNLFYRLKRLYFKNNLKNYPRAIYVYYAEAISTIRNAQWCLAGKPVEEALFPIKINSIQLASKRYLVEKNKINWVNNFVDEEDYLVLHRWNWMLTLLSNPNINHTLLASWVNENLKAWCKLYISELSTIKKAEDQLHWESYTVSERLANTVLFFHLTGYKPDPIIQSAYLKMVYFLLPRVEYGLNQEVGNHVINNARGLYLAGVALGDISLKKFSMQIIAREMPTLVTQDGFLREGSSHYQLLFTRWILEIKYFAKVSGDKKSESKLEAWVAKLIKGCEFFLYPNKLKARSFPLYGDISPDYSPKWVENKLLNYFSDLKINLSHYPHTVTYPHAHWYRLVQDEHILFFHYRQKNSTVHPHHQHQDFLHFSLYYKGLPILVDSGRKSYHLDTVSLLGLSAQAHNSVLINNLEVSPFLSHRYPARYLKDENQLKIALEKEFAKVTLNTHAFKRLHASINFKRSLELVDKKLVVLDQFEGKGRYTIQLFFHFAANIIISPLPNKKWQIKTPNATGIFFLDNNIKNIKIELLHGARHIMGHRYYAYGKYNSAYSFFIKAEALFPITLQSIIQWI